MQQLNEKISGLIITFNEEKNMREVLECFDFCDEIIVVDSFSTDKTIEIASTFPKVKTIQNKFEDFTKQRNIALDAAKNDWVLFLDGDERITSELQEEILKTVKDSNAKDAYYFYKANWNQEPMLYLAEKRNTERKNPLQNFMAFTNTGGAELFINGKSYGKKKADELNMVKWENISLEKGDNKIEVVSGGKPLLRDGCVVKY